MSCYKIIDGKFAGMTQVICNEMVAALDEDDCYAEYVAFDPDGSVSIYGQMGYGTASNWDDVLQELALRFGLAGSFKTECDSDRWDFYVGTPEQQRDAELADVTEQLAELRERQDALNAMQF
jgi:hypothetical protein